MIFFEKHFFKYIDRSDSAKAIKEDYRYSFEEIKKGNYRSAYRNLIPILDYYHRETVQLLDGIYGYNKKNKSTKCRDEFISKFVEKLDNSVFKEKWEKISHSCKEIFAVKKEEKDSPKLRENTRNTLVHGYYNNSEINVSEKEVIKLFILTFNLNTMFCHFNIWSIYVRDKIKK